jgi:hypothetical protein
MIQRASDSTSLWILDGPASFAGVRDESASIGGRLRERAALLGPAAQKSNEKRVIAVF